MSPLPNLSHPDLDTAALLSAIVDGSEDAIVSKTLDGIITSWNKGAEKIFGYEAEEIIGKPIYTLIPHDRTDEEPQILSKLRRGEQVSHYETVRVRKDGAYINISVTISPIRNARGEIVGASKIAKDITHQKKTELALSKAEKREQENSRTFELVVKGAQIGVWDCILPFSDLNWDDKVKEHFQISPDVNPGIDDFYACIHPGDREMVRQAIDESISGRKLYEVELRTLSSENNVKWVRVVGRAYYDNQGTPVRFSGVSMDVTAYTRMRQKLSESERRFRAVVEASPECVKIVGPDGSLEYMNPAGLRMIEAGREESVKGTCVYDLITDDYREEWIEMHKHVCQGEKLSWQFKVHGLQGAELWMETHAVPIENLSGGYSQLAVTREITERKRIEETQATEKSILELIAKGSSAEESLIALISGIERLSSNNMRCAFLLMEEGAEYLELVAGPGIPDPLRQALSRIPVSRIKDLNAGSNREVCADQFDNHTLSTDRRILSQVASENGFRSAVSTPITGNNGEILGTVEAFFYQAEAAAESGLINRAIRLAGIIIEKKQTESLLSRSLKAEQAARSEAERASRMKDEFLTTLSHELRTPLNSIVGWSQVLRADKYKNRLDEGLEIIARNGKAQAQIINDLLDMSRITAGKLRLDIEQVDVSEALKAAIETVRPSIDAKAIKLVPLLSCADCITSADSGRLQQVFWNILSNAVKFTPKGGRIEVKLQRIDSHIDITVSDSGQGIKKDFLPYIFDRFRQADASTTRTHGGLGIGLSIVRQLIELHGGTITAESRGEMQGATFKVVLPVTILSRRDLPKTGDQQHEPGVLSDYITMMPGVRALVIDDEKDARALIKRLLEDCEVTVETAESAEAAIFKLSDFSPDVIISDIGMPGEDGYSFIRKLRKLEDPGIRDLPAIALTAYARPEDRLSAIQAGFDMHLVKPVDPHELVTMVAGVLRRRAKLT